MNYVDALMMLPISVATFVVLCICLYTVFRRVTNWSSEKARAISQAITALVVSLFCWWLCSVYFAVGFLGVQCVLAAIRQRKLSREE